MKPRYWWQEPADDPGSWSGASEGDDVSLAPADAPLPPAAPPARSRLEDDPVRLKAYRAELSRKALLLPRCGARRRAVEKQLAKITADLLRCELGVAPLPKRALRVSTSPQGGGYRR